jgi:hypothetical protein
MHTKTPEENEKDRLLAKWKRLLDGFDSEKVREWVRALERYEQTAEKREPLWMKLIDVAPMPNPVVEAIKENARLMAVLDGEDEEDGA